MPDESRPDWEHWQHRRRVAAAITLAVIVWGTSELPNCRSTDCISANVDRVTNSLLGPTDSPTTFYFPSEVMSVSGTGGTTFAQAGVAEGTGTAHSAWAWVH